MKLNILVVFSIITFCLVYFPLCFNESQRQVVYDRACGVCIVISFMSVCSMHVQRTDFSATVRERLVERCASSSLFFFGRVRTSRIRKYAVSPQEYKYNTDLSVDENIRII